MRIGVYSIHPDTGAPDQLVEVQEVPEPPKWHGTNGPTEHVLAHPIRGGQWIVMVPD